MSKAKFQAAKELIEQKKYDEARVLLNTIDNPTAWDWLAKLDKIDPPRRVYIPAPPPPRLESRPTIRQGGSGGRKWAIWGFAIVVALALFVVATVVIYTTLTKTANGTLLCDESGWWNQARPLTVQFLDTAQTASQSPRISLGAIIVQMTQTQRQFEGITAPGCMQPVYHALDSAMSSAVDGFNEFLGQNEFVARISLNQATQYFSDAWHGLLTHSLTADQRMYDTATFLWGGDAPNTSVTPLAM